MVLAYTPDSTNLDKFAQMAGKIIEVAAPYMALLTTSSTPSGTQH